MVPTMNYYNLGVTHTRFFFIETLHFRNFLQCQIYGKLNIHNVAVHYFSLSIITKLKYFFHSINQAVDVNTRQCFLTLQKSVYCFAHLYSVTNFQYLPTSNYNNFVVCQCNSGLARKSPGLCPIRRIQVRVCKESVNSVLPISVNKHLPLPLTKAI